MRRARNAEGELAAFGKLGACYQEIGDWQAAEKYASDGLAQASRLQLPLREADFHTGLGMMMTELKRHKNALEHYKTATSLYFEHNAVEKESAVLALLARAAGQCRNVRTLWIATARAITLCGTVSQQLGIMLVTVVAQSIRMAVQIGDWPATRAGLTTVLTAFENARNSGPDTATAGAILILTMKWVTGEDLATCNGIARQLDQSTGGKLELAAWFSAPYASTSQKSRYSFGKTIDDQIAQWKIVFMNS